MPWKRSELWLKAFGDHCHWFGIYCDETQKVFKIDLRNNSLSGTLPSSLGMLTSLQVLDLSLNNIKGLVPSSLNNLTNLYHLNLSSNSFEDIEQDFELNEQLQELDLSKNSLQNIFEVKNESFEKYFQLKVLKISKNYLKTFPNGLSFLSNLQTLDASENTNLQLGTELWTLTNLQSLDVSKIALTSLPSNIKNLNSLNKLKMNSNQLVSVPSEVGLLENLIELDISSNSLTTLPTSLSQLENLKILLAGYNKLVEFKDLYFKNLKELQLENLDLKICNFTKVLRNGLEKLSFTGEEVFPSSFRDSKLKQLAIQGTVKDLPYLPESMEILNLNGFAYNSFKNDTLPNLYHFSVSSSGDHFPFPKWIARSPLLEILEFDLVDSTIPSEIGVLTNLRIINLSQGDLHGTIPTEMGLLKNLETLSILGVNVTGTIPTEFSQLKSLKEIKLMNTGLKGKLDTSLSSLNNVDSCTFGETEKVNLFCETNKVEGMTICNIGCKGDTLDGLWMNQESECQILEKGVDILFWYKQALTFSKNRFEIIWTVSFFCDDSLDFIYQKNGTYEVTSESILSDGSHLLNLSFTTEQTTGFINSIYIPQIVSSSCGIPVANGINDFTFTNCELKPSSISIYSKLDCPIIQSQMIVDFKTQTMKSNLKDDFFQGCKANRTNTFESETLRRWWKCSDFSIYQIECVPQCGDSIILVDEKCDDGNGFPDDGCSSTCQIEDNWECDYKNGKSICSFDCGHSNWASKPELCPETNSSDSLWWVAVVVVVIVVILLIVSVALYIYKSKSKGVIIRENDLELLEPLGEGNFGRVLKAVWRGTTEVAVKELKNSSNELLSKEHFENFEKEAMLLSKLPPHPNIVQFLGICVIQSNETRRQSSISPPPSSPSSSNKLKIVTEFIIGGNVVEFLRGSPPTIKQGIVEPKQYLVIIELGKGICAGMDHLHQNKILHRDLAARNILILLNTVSKHEEQRLKPVPKISDFGLSSSRMKSNVPVPVRWSAPEVLVDSSQFLKASDVWSFGVVMYEMINNCSIYPYFELKNTQVRDYILQGGRLQARNDWPLQYSQMMVVCLSFHPNFRPSFLQLSQSFSVEFDNWKETDIPRKSNTTEKVPIPIPVPVLTDDDTDLIETEYKTFHNYENLNL